MLKCIEMTFRCIYDFFFSVCSQRNPHCFHFEFPANFQVVFALLVAPLVVFAAKISIILEHLVDLYVDLVTQFEIVEIPMQKDMRKKVENV